MKDSIDLSVNFTEGIKNKSVMNKLSADIEKITKMKGSPSAEITKEEINTVKEYREQLDGVNKKLSELREKEKSLNAQYSEQEEKLKSQQDKLNNAFTTEKLKASYEQAREELTQTQIKLEKLKKTQEGMDDSGINKNTKVYRANKIEIQQTEKEIERLNKIIESDSFTALENVKAKLAEALKQRELYKESIAGSDTLDTATVEAYGLNEDNIKAYRAEIARLKADIKSLLATTKTGNMVAGQMPNAIEKTKSAMKNIQKQMSANKGQITQNVNKYNELTKALESYEKEADDVVRTQRSSEHYAEYLEQQKEASEQVRDVEKEMEDASREYFDKIQGEIDSLLNRTPIELLEGKIEILRDKLAQLLQSQKADTPNTQKQIITTVEQIQKLQTQLEKLNQEYEKVKQTKDDVIITPPPADIPKIDTQNIEEATEETNRFATVAKSIVVNGLRNVADASKKMCSALYNSGRSILLIFGRVGGYIGSKLLPIIGKIGSSIKGSISSGINKITGKFKRLTSLVSRRLIYKAVNAVTEAITNDIGALAKYSSSFNKAISDAKSSLANLGANILSAFAPVIEEAIPILVSFVDILTQAVQKIGIFFATLTGKSTVIKATKTNYDYAASLDETTSSAKDANKQLGEYDNLLVISQDTDSSSGSSSGSSITPSYITETIGIDGASTFAEQLKTAWNNQDFSGVGSIISTKLKDALDKIDWNTIQSKAGSIATKTASLINGFFSNSDLFASIGSTISNSISTVLSTGIKFTGTLNTKQIGIDLGRALNNLNISKILGQCGEMINNLVDKALDLAIGFFETFDFTTFVSEITSGAINFIKAIKWIDLLKKCIVLIGEAISKVSWKTLTDGILEGILNSTGSSKYQEFADNLGEEFNKLSTTQKLILWFKFKCEDEPEEDSVPTAAKCVGEDAVSGFTEGAEKEDVGKTGSSIGSGFITAFKLAIGSPWEVVKVKFEDLKTKITTKFEEIKTKATDKWTEIKTKIVNKATEIKDKVHTAFTTMKEKVTDAITSLKNKIKTPINAILTFMQKLINGVTSAINTVIKALNKLKITIPSWVPGGYGGKTLGFNLSTITAPKIPLLAQGAVIPPNKEFLAVLGDQKSGTNIETPLETMIQAFETALNSRSTGEPIVLQLDGKTVAKVVWSESEKRYKQTGKSFAY